MLVASLVSAQFATASDPLENYTGSKPVHLDTQNATKFPKRITKIRNGVNTVRYNFEYDGICRLSNSTQENWNEENGWYAPNGQVAYVWDENDIATINGGTEYTRDKYGRLIKQSTQYYTMTDGKQTLEVTYVTEYTYDETGRTLSILNYYILPNNSEIVFNYKVEASYDITNYSNTENSIRYEWSATNNSWMITDKNSYTIYEDSEKSGSEFKQESYIDGELTQRQIEQEEYTILNHGVKFLTKRINKTDFTTFYDYLSSSELITEIVPIGENDFKAIEIGTSTLYDINTNDITRQQSTKKESEYKIGCMSNGVWACVVVKSSKYTRTVPTEEWTLKSTVSKELNDKLEVLKENSVKYSSSSSTETEIVYTRDNLGRTILSETFTANGNSTMKPQSKVEYEYYLDTDYMCSYIGYTYERNKWNESSSMKMEYDPNVQMTEFQNSLLRKSGLDIPVYITPVKYSSVISNGYTTISEEVNFEYHDRADISSVEVVEVYEDEQAEYYDLQGRPANLLNLKSGVYIRRCGNQATKVIIK